METPEVVPAHIRNPEACWERTKKLGRYLTRPFGVHLDEESAYRWMEIVSLFRITDDFLDDFSNGDLAERSQLIESTIHEPGRFSEWFPHLTPENLGDTLYEHTQKTGAHIVKTNFFIKTTTNPDRYIGLRQAEGRTSARLLTVLTSEDFQAQDNFARFCIGMDFCGETVNLADSFLDIHEDARNGEVQFTPNLAFRARLLGRIATRTVHYAPALIRTAHTPKA